MPATMSRQIENADGMYPYVDLVKNPTAEGWAQFSRHVASTTDPTASLAEMVVDALRIQHGTTDEQRRKAAENLVFLIETAAPERLRAGDGKAILALGILIGRTDERIHAMQFEPNVQTGRKCLKASKKASNKLTRGTQDRYRKINAWIAEKLKARCKVSLTERRRQAAEQFGVSYDTVLKAQKTIRKK